MPSDLMEAHRDLSQILASFALAWNLKAEGPRAEIEKINAKYDGQIEVVESRSQGKITRLSVEQSERDLAVGA